MNILQTSESVTEGHPDKICDQIADCILDECLRQDRNSRVAVEAIVKSDKVVVFGEITSKAKFSTKKIVKDVFRKIGYTEKSLGFKLDDLQVFEYLTKQSNDISQGVTEEKGLYKEMGAGDQGIMYGYACLETEELMPLPIMVAHKICKKLSDVRKNKEIDYLRPDGKTQVTFEYENEKPKRLHTIVLSCQHDDGISQEQIRKDLKNKVIKEICGNWIDKDTIYHVNSTGRFVIGGPVADSGLSGKKTGVDTYGGLARHGGGSFSGKDPTKVDRSATYATRFAAKNLVANGFCEKCEVSFAYAIGVAEPVAISVDCFGTSKFSEMDLVKIIKSNFPIKPADIISNFKLQMPIFQDTSVYGHFGRLAYSWEKVREIKL